MTSEDDPDQLVLPWSHEPYAATWDEFLAHFGTTPHRASLAALAYSRFAALLDARIPIFAVWLNGSFVTDADRPSDLDVVVLIDGPRLPALRLEAGLSPAEALLRVQQLPRYEQGGTASSHATDFQYVTYYPDDSPWSHTVQDELDHWFTAWSRLEVGRHSGGPRGKLVEDAKGFVEVRW